MESSSRLPQRILHFYDDMPRRERRLADLLLEEPTYLCSGLAAHIGETSIERLRRIEDIHGEWGDGVDADW